MERVYSDEFFEFLQNFPAVAIIGAHQQGWDYLDLEKGADRQLVECDPDLFLKLHPGRLILDEAQELPQLFPALRVAIDEDRERMGRFILTGSSTPHLLQSLSESLAGRIATIPLSPLSFCWI